MKHVGNITKLSGYGLPLVDCVAGGSPCQDLSVAGLRAGLAGERSGLFMEQIRIVKELRDAYFNHIRSGRTDQSVRLCRFLVWENVLGAFSSNRGKDFQTVLTEIVRTVEPDSPDVPMPDKGRWPHAGCLYDQLGGWSVAWRLHDAQFWGVPQRRKRVAVVADFRGLSAPEVLFERKGLQGDSAQSGEAREGTAGDAESGIDRTGVFPINVIVQPIMVEMTSTKNTVIEDGISPTLTARIQVNAVCVGNGQLNQMSMAETANTLDTMHDQQAVLCYQNTGQGWWNESEIGATVRTPCGGDSVKANLVIEKSCVRRLTPLECERLQGFPDGWTDIGDWTDTKGKRHKLADSHRYKALGNSIALPFWFWLLRRISAQYSRPAYLGSLFDGIGGFPLCRERCNGKGTALWASEIEEFPITVTKHHFPEEDDEQS